MPRTSAAVAAVSGPVLERGWSRIRGSSQGLDRQRQMTRAAVRHFPAIFKPIKSGGCHTRAQLRAQLEYLTTKSSHIIDSRGTYDGQKTLNGKQIEKVASRFADRWGERFNPKMGHTTHLLMAFPVGTRGTDVRDIAQDVCERFFEQGPSRFDYIVAVHEDRAHPHAHVVLNRRSPDGEMFYLGRDHRFNYDDFREAMVTAAERHGVRLEATRRLERGITSHKAPIEEIHRAKEEGRAPVERQRVGKSLDTALVEIARYSRTYRSLSAIASAENREDLADALFSAGEILAKGGHLKADGVVYMAKDESFDSLVSDFSDRVQELERVIEDRAPQERAELERRLSDVLQSVSHLNPLGERSHTLDRPPSEGGVYSQGNIDRDNLDRLTDQQTRAQIDAALRGTGISSSQVISRVETAADNAALEQRWLADDLRAIADRDRLDLSRSDERERAVDRLDDVHARLGTVLTEARVLRADGLLHGDSPEYDAAMERYAADMREAAFADRQTAADRDHAERVSERLANERGAGLWEDEGIARAERSSAAEGSTRDELLERMRDDPTARAFRTEGEARAFREEIEAELDEPALERLRAGDADALAQSHDDRLDRLHLAKAYLESDSDTAWGEARDRVLTEIVDEEIEAERLRHSQAHGEKGTTHG